MKNLLADISESIGECYPLDDNRCYDFIDKFLPKLKKNIEENNWVKAEEIFDGKVNKKDSELCKEIISEYIGKKIQVFIKEK